MVGFFACAANTAEAPDVSPTISRWITLRLRVTRVIFSGAGKVAGYVYYNNGMTSNDHTIHVANGTGIDLGP
jgi:hypothetical protein